jgi:hypothetical protein
VCVPPERIDFPLRLFQTHAESRQNKEQQQ